MESKLIREALSWIGGGVSRPYLALEVIACALAVLSLVLSFLLIRVKMHARRKPLRCDDEAAGNSMAVPRVEGKKAQANFRFLNIKRKENAKRASVNLQHAPVNRDKVSIKEISEAPIAMPVVSFVPANGLPRKTSLIIEALIAAGPRKLSTREYDDRGNGADLCEDGAGILLAGEDAYFWVADGASDGPILSPDSLIERTVPAEMPQLPYPALSARILCQDLGRVFSELVGELGGTEPEFYSDNLRRAMAQRIVELWEDRFTRLLRSAHHANTLDALADSFPRRHDGTYVLDWSSTFLAGRLTQGREGNVLAIRNFGDCSGVVVGENAAVWECAPQNNQRIFMRCLIADGPLQPNSEFKFHLTLRDRDRVGVANQFDNISHFLFGSDGFGKGGPAALRPHVEKIVADGAQIGRRIRDLVRNHVGKEYDDKALIVGRVVRLDSEP